VGGRLVAPSESGQGQQNLVVIDKTENGLVRTVLEPVLFVPLKSGVS
jgi:protein-L-isoaspartate(D-aspartate) O-methyltransferase